MKKVRGVLIGLAILLAVGVTGFVVVHQRVTQAKIEQNAVYTQYAQLCRNAADTALTVTENGETVGVYTLSDLGLEADVLAQVERAFGEADRMPPEAFGQLLFLDQLSWRREVHPQVDAVDVDLDDLDLRVILEDLDLENRTPARDAYVTFENGAYRVHPEVAGNQLREDVVVRALTEAVTGFQVTQLQAQSLSLELTELGCYILPQVTAADGFDFAAMLAEDLRGMELTLDFQGSTERLAEGSVAALVTVDETGALQLDETALGQIVSGWAAKYQKNNTPYLFHAYVGGVKPIDFLKVDYAVDQEALAELLRQRLLALESASVEAPFRCTRNGEAFAIEGEYIEVDIPNQVMTYVREGEVFVTTDVVTGATWGYATPTGLYKVENKDTDCWLSGPDYNVFVEYWVGFIGYVYGIHDASWRTKFGGDNYISNGSHGCVNTPTEAMKRIYETVEPGVPVLVYGE